MQISRFFNLPGDLPTLIIVNEVWKKKVFNFRYIIKNVRNSHDSHIWILAADANMKKSKIRRIDEILEKISTRFLSFEQLRNLNDNQLEQIAVDLRLV